MLKQLMPENQDVEHVFYKGNLVAVYPFSWNRKEEHEKVDLDKLIKDDIERAVAKGASELGLSVLPPLLLRLATGLTPNKCNLNFIHYDDPCEVKNLPESWYEVIE